MPFINNQIFLCQWATFNSRITCSYKDSNLGFSYTRTPIIHFLLTIYNHQCPWLYTYVQVPFARHYSVFWALPLRLVRQSEAPLGGRGQRCQVPGWHHARGRPARGPGLNGSQVPKILPANCVRGSGLEGAPKTSDRGTNAGCSGHWGVEEQKHRITNPLNTRFCLAKYP